MIGLPIVGLATTELATVIRNGVNGFVDTDVDAARRRDAGAARRRPALARAPRRRGPRARALERFGIDRFVADWHGGDCPTLASPDH